MGLFKKNDKWWIDYYVNGHRIRKPVSKSKLETEKVLLKIKSDLLMKRYAIPKNEKIRFVDFAMKYIEDYSKQKKRSFKSDLTILKHLVKYFGDLFIDEINDYHIEQYRNERSKQKLVRKDKLVSQTTINRECALIRGILNRAVLWGFLSFNPVRKFEMVREEPKERILSKEEMGLLISSANIPLKHIILVALNTGMRMGEILNLEWNQINLDQGFISVKKTKSKKLRTIPMNLSMKRLFSELSLKRKGQYYVFENPETKKHLVSFKTSWTTLLKRTGIKELRFHDLRHCFATYSLLNGGDLISLKDTLGHSRIDTTVRYTKALLEGKQKLVNAFEVPENFGELIDFIPEKKVSGKNIFQ